MKTFERELPEGYVPVLEVDAKNKKTAILMNLAALAIFVAAVLLALAIIRPFGFFEYYSLTRNLVFIAAMLAYMVLHELVHGLVYKQQTREKLTFGITFSAAYCGVPGIYVYRKTALLSLLAPFVVFIVVFMALIFLLNDPWDQFYAAMLLGLHVGGCSGDLYDTGLYLFKLKDPSVLVKDDGPKQVFYAKKDGTLIYRND